MKRVAIIGGTGALGAALARRLARQGYPIGIGSRDPLRAAVFAENLRAEIPSADAKGAGLSETAREAEICILTVPYAAHAETLEQIRAEVQGKIVLDTTVPLKPPKVGTVQLPRSGSAAVDAATILGSAVHVVSALHTIGAEKLAGTDPIDADVLVAGDDADSVSVIRAMLTAIGLRSWHVGPLANSSAAEAMTSVLIQINRRYKIDQAGIRITGKLKGTPEQARQLTVRALSGLPLFSAGHDLVASLADAIAGQASLSDGDVIVVAQKVVSKIEDRAVLLSTIVPGASAISAASTSVKDPAVVELIERESQELMRIKPGVIIARHKLGHVAANAGIDASNVPSDRGEQALLWPVDPDASARVIRLGLENRFSVKLAVVISDSLGRAWRMGTTGTAIGCSGLKPLRDRRGEQDLFGRVLQATVIGVADEIAAAASLVMGEGAEGLPAVIVSGAIYERDELAGISALLRPRTEDLFP